MIILAIICTILALVAGGVGGYYYRHRKVQDFLQKTQFQADKSLEQAKQAAEKIRSEAAQTRDALEKEAKLESNRRQQRINQQRERHKKRQDHLNQQLSQLKGREQALNKKQQELKKRRRDINKLQDKQIAAIETVAQSTQDETRAEILHHIREDILKEQTHYLRNREEELKGLAERKARDLITLAIQRTTGRQVSPNASSTLQLNKKQLEQFLSKDQRNLKEFERLGAVELALNETEVTLSINAADPVQREIARRALDMLLNEGNIHPGRIASTLKKVNRSVNTSIKRAGRNALRKARVKKLAPEVVNLLGRLEYRTSYGQNQRLHLIETAHLAAIMAHELGADIEIARLGGLLHDIGKALTHEIEGPHALIGAEALQGHNIDPRVINAVASHHHEVEQESLEAIIVEAADAISGARPGARRENLESYVARITELEGIANSFTGVKESFAIQAGREIRVYVNPDKVDDTAAQGISRDIAQKVEENLQYPGQIAITVIRETKAVDYAR